MRAFLTSEADRFFGREAEVEALLDRLLSRELPDGFTVPEFPAGKDVATRTLIAFGGAAPLHAARLAEKLGIGQEGVSRLEQRSDTQEEGREERFHGRSFWAGGMLRKAE